MEIRVLGPGCMKCMATKEAVKEALEELGIESEIHHVTDFNEILGYGVMMTPAVVINGKVKCFGKIPGKEQVVAWIEEETE